MQSAALTCSSPPSRPERPGSGCRWPLVRLSSRWSVTSASDTSPNLGGSPWAELGFLSAVLSVLSWRRRRSTSLSNRRCTFSCSAGAPGWARSADHASPQASSVARSVCLINETFTSECNQPSSGVIWRHMASSGGHQVVIRWSSGGHQVVIRWSSEGHQVVIRSHQRPSAYLVVTSSSSESIFSNALSFSVAWADARRICCTSASTVRNGLARVPVGRGGWAP